MSEEDISIDEIKVKLIKAGKSAALELVKVAEKKLILKDKKAGDNEELAADKLKNAATAKKMAIFDAFDILDRIKKEEEAVTSDQDNTSETTKEAVTTKSLDFKSAEERA